MLVFSWKLGQIKKPIHISGDSPHSINGTLVPVTDPNVGDRGGD